MGLRSFDIFTSSPDEIVFGFDAGQYNGPLSEPTYRREVLEMGIRTEVDHLLRGTIPQRFDWMRPVVEDQVANQEVNKPLRFMSVVEELKRAQSSDSRDLYYEAQVEALGRLLYDSCDENFNFLGFWLNIKTRDGEVHSHQWGILRLNPVDNQWWVNQEYPITEIEEIAPRQAP